MTEEVKFESLSIETGLARGDTSVQNLVEVFLVNIVIVGRTKLVQSPICIKPVN